MHPGVGGSEGVRGRLTVLYFFILYSVYCRYCRYCNVFRPLHALRPLASADFLGESSGSTPRVPRSFWGLVSRDRSLPRKLEKSIEMRLLTCTPRPLIIVPPLTYRTPLSYDLPGIFTHP